DNDYEVNVKSEVEIHLLHEKIDYLMATKWQHLVELQQVQIELLQELIDQKKIEDE
ncbi:MAG: cyclic nucleotide-binding protein, partial [Enterococcus sp.]